ncbi:hypothetical protein C8R44DRAFT_864308 [Mycena epipterygia]|nr:hypothetical protein C8R44DRAFT_864308 [Mycena epipterygia]
MVNSNSLRAVPRPLDPSVEHATRVLKIISNVNARRNQLAPISKLAPELLSEIFLVVAAYTRVSARHPGYLFHVEVRICTIGVCRHWRAVAMGCASLWGYIDFSRDSAERVKEALLISKPIPLVVAASLLQYLQNTKVTPALQVLRLNCARSNVELSPDIFARETPRLRELELRGCVIPEALHLLRNLTYLSIDEVPLDSRFTVVQWLGILGSIPSLEVISLSECFSPEESRRTLSLIHLPHLFSLALQSCFDNCSDMLKYLVFPSTPCLEITCNSAYSDPDGDSFFFLADALGEKLPPTQKLRSLGISWTSEELKFRGSTDETGDVSPRSEGSEFYFEAEVPERVFELTLATINRLSTAHIVVLDLGMPLCRHSLSRSIFESKTCRCSPPPFDSDREWRVLLHGFPVVHTLKGIQYDWASIVLTILAPSPDSGTVDADRLLPALHTLGLVNTAFNFPRILPSLLRLLRWRRENGKPIAKIGVDFCTNVASKIQLLQNEGVSVEWDDNDRFEDE